jgi:hypothetical protein
MQFLNVLGAKLGADDPSDLVHQRLVKHCCQADCLWENGCIPGAGDAMQTLVPPVVFRNTQARDRICGMTELRNLFLQGHPLYQVVYPLFDGKLGVLIGRCFLSLYSQNGREEQN